MVQGQDPTSYRSEFPLTNEWTYVNHAEWGPYPQRTVAAVQEYAEKWANPAAFDDTRNATILRETKEGLAALAGGSAENVAFVGSLANAMNIMGNGLEWQTGDNILIPRHEFPSVVYPFLNLERKGVEVRFVESDNGSRIDVEGLTGAADDRTRAIAISHVEWRDGYRNDLKSIGSFCKDRDIELFVDATQSLGAQPIDLHETGVTAIGAHGYKWLLSSFGNGVLIFNEGAAERLQPAFVGRLSVTADAEDLNWQLNFRQGAERYQTGGVNMQSITGLHASLSILNDIGSEGTSQQTDRLTQRLAAGLENQGYQVISDRSPEHRSQILTFSSGNSARNEEITNDLKNRQVSLSLRSGNIRVSPFFYNNEDDIDRLLECLPPL